MKKSRKYKMQRAAKYDTVTVKDLGRAFNKNDFNVGQKIDIIRKRNPLPTVWDGPWIIGRVENSGLKWTKECGGFTTKFDSIHSVRYHKMPKRPKSAMKKKSPSKKARSPRKKPPSPRKVKAAKKIQKYVKSVMKKGRKYKMKKKKSTAKKADRHPHSRKPSIEDFVEVEDVDLSLANTFDQVSDDYYNHAGQRYTLPNGTLSSARYLAKLKRGRQPPLTGNGVFEIEIVNRNNHKNAGQGTHLVHKIWFQPGPKGRWWYSDAVRQARRLRRPTLPPVPVGFGPPPEHARRLRRPTLPPVPGGFGPPPQDG